MAMVLNALSIDPGRKWKGPWRWFDESMLDCYAPLEKVKAKGISFGKVVCLAHCARAKVEAFRTNQSNIDEFRKHLIACSTSDDCPVISSYNRATFKQASFNLKPFIDYESDVARFRYPPHRVPLKLLWEAMDTLDDASGFRRGFMLISRLQHPPALLYTLPTLPAFGRNELRVGNIEHISRIANKIMQLGNSDTRIQMHIQKSSEWNEWQPTALQKRGIRLKMFTNGLVAIKEGVANEGFTSAAVAIKSQCDMFLPLAYLCRHFNQPNGRSLYQFIGLSKVSKLPTQTILEMHIVVYSSVIPDLIYLEKMWVFLVSSVLQLYWLIYSVSYLAVDGLFPEWKIWTQFLDESTEVSSVLQLYWLIYSVSYLVVDGLFPEWKIWTQFLDESTEGLRWDGLSESHHIEDKLELNALNNNKHHKKLKNLDLGDLLVDGGEEGGDGDPNMSMNLLTVAGTDNVAFLDELLKARLDPV
ncbi:hypothetical protein L2E82_20289 [Cichorium intybus]|uniref:Uncharacterized protein n=1 Tax=Cichorium intybus TaxID=13427 RepID=A0ACB9DTP0_CICIN|nr:hypothetical protein L2E82_20289 [Cichorium intybus]